MGYRNDIWVIEMTSHHAESVKNLRGESDNS